MADHMDMSSVQPNTLLSVLDTGFFGSYDHSIDGKGRIIIPNAYREGLGDSFTITVEPDDEAIAIYPDRTFAEMVSGLMKLNRRNPAVQMQLEHIAKFSYPRLQADAQGRILLPSKLRQFVLAEAKDVEISGAIDHIRIADSVVANRENDEYRNNNLQIRSAVAELEERE